MAVNIGVIFMLFSINLLAKAAKLHISRQRYYFFRTYARVRVHFYKKSRDSLKNLYLMDT